MPECCQSRGEEFSWGHQLGLKDLTAGSALHAGFSIRWPYNEVAACVDDHPVARPLEEEDHFATSRYNILQAPDKFDATPLEAEQMLLLLSSARADVGRF